MLRTGIETIICLLNCLTTRGVARIFEWGDERRRREKRGTEGAEGGRVRGGGHSPLPRKILII